MFSEKVINKISGALLYGITPPKLETDREKMISISDKRTARINALNADALVVYDIQDESNRNNETRPFPFFPTIDPYNYVEGYHKNIECEKILYQVVGKYNSIKFNDRLIQINNKNYLSVFVGAASKHQEINMNLDEAYNLWNESKSKSLLGGIVIPERHNSKKDEHLRIIEKQKKGCSFFISQYVCNIEMVKNFISDYWYEVNDKAIESKYFIFTLSPCGTLETLRLMKWLGINIPKWMENDLLHCKDILEESVRQNIRIIQELIEYCTAKNIPYGFNVESLSPKKLKIDASVELFNETRKAL